jgi:hypothetical protein
MCLSIIKAAVQITNWTHVHNHVAKVRPPPFATLVNHHHAMRLGCYMGFVGFSQCGLQAMSAGVAEKDFPGLETELHCAAGIAHLAMRNFEMAATEFLKADVEHCNLPHLLSRRDVAA